jgi:hypothetical protein
MLRPDPFDHPPIGLEDGINLWTYVENNPLIWIDPWGLYTQEELAAIIYNETASLSGVGIYDARLAIGFVAINREGAGILGGIAPFTLSRQEQLAIKNKVPSAITAYLMSLRAASTALNKCGSDPTQGAKEFNLRGSSSKSPRRGVPVLLQFGPFNNSYPTVGNPNVLVIEQLPASGVYINIFGRAKK